MAQSVLMPQMGISEESAVLAAWHVKPGDAVKVGSPLFALETGKAAFEVESEFEGVVLALLCEEGDEKLIKEPVCVIGEAGETFEAASVEKPVEDQPVQTEVVLQQPIRREVASGERVGISPRARQLADKAGVSAADATPTGPENRIIERDVRSLIESGVPVQPKVQASAAKKPEADYTDQPHSAIRKAIAKNMSLSLSTLAQLTHQASFDAGELLALRAKCKQSDGLEGVTIGDLVLYGVARTLLTHPELNAHYTDQFLRVFSHVQLGVAVDTPRGLMVPTIRDADMLRVRGLSAECKRLAAQCQNGTPEMAPASFTVSNLGNFGIEMFTPVINPPQVAILGVCNITTRVKPDGTPYPAMGLSLTYDHRAIDGAPASRFLRDLCRNLENIQLLTL